MAATGKRYFGRQSYRFLTGEREAVASDRGAFELDESDIWNATARSTSPEWRRSVPSSRSSRKAPPSASKRGGDAASSLPMNIPDWSKILKDDYAGNRERGDDDEIDCDEEDEDSGGGDGLNRIPPHEFLARQFARTRIASFSVHEGIGRTLKGRDLSRVRNAIWEKTGFED